MTDAHAAVLRHMDEHGITVDMLLCRSCAWDVRTDGIFFLRPLRMTDVVPIPCEIHRETVKTGLVVTGS